MSKELHIWVKRPAKAATGAGMSAHKPRVADVKPAPAAKPVETCKCGGKHV